MSFLKHNQFVLDLDNGLLKHITTGKTEPDDSRLVDGLLQYGKRYMLEFIDTPLLSGDSMYRVIYQGEIVHVNTWQEFVSWLF